MWVYLSYNRLVELCFCRHLPKCSSQSRQTQKDTVHSQCCLYLFYFGLHLSRRLSQGQVRSLRIKSNSLIWLLEKCSQCRQDFLFLNMWHDIQLGVSWAYSLQRTIKDLFLIIIPQLEACILFLLFFLSFFFFLLLNDSNMFWQIGATSPKLHAITPAQVNFKASH